MTTGCHNLSGSSYVFAMDTFMELTVYGKNAADALDACEREIYRLDELLSPENENSDIYKINSAKGDCVTVSPETALLLKRAKTISEQTGGAFDITVYPLVSEWGFFSREYNIPDNARLEYLVRQTDYRKVSVDGDTVRVDGDCMIDLGAIAKGYLTDRLRDILSDNGIERAVLSLGGNVLLVGSKTKGQGWSVGIQDPNNPATYFGVLSASDAAVITSGGYNRYFERDGVIYHHILDPSTGFPSRSGVISMTIISSDATLADALSTALFVSGSGAASDFWRKYGGFEFIAVTDDGNVHVTAGLRGHFSLEQDSVYTLSIIV